MIKSTGALLLFAALSAGQAMASDVAFRGNLLDRPCHVSGDSLKKHVVFKTRASEGFLVSARTFADRVVCHQAGKLPCNSSWQNCDPDL